MPGHYTGLNMQLRAIKKPIEEGLIGFEKGFFERHPAAAFLFDEGTERRERLTHDMILSQWQR